MKRRALIHVDNTEGILELADYLASAGWTILSANKNEELFRKQKIAVTHEPVLSDSNLYISDSSRLIQQIISTRIDTDEYYDQNGNNDNNIFLVCINVHPEMKLSNEKNSLENPFSKFDFFITTMLKNSCSNYENILILTDPADYKEAIIQLKTGSISKKFRTYLAGKALSLVSAFDGGISSTVLKNPVFENRFSTYLTYPFEKEIKLAYGTNKQQEAYLYKVSTNQFYGKNLQQLQGSEPSFTEMSDVFYAWEQINTLYTVLKNQFKIKSTNADGYDFTTQFTPLTGTVFTIAVKFNSIVGAALSTNVLDSFIKTCSYDSKSIDGVVYACSSVIDENAAMELIKYRTSAVVAPGFTPEAKELFSQNKNIRLIPTGKLQNLDFDGKILPGGILLQTKDSVLFDHWKVKSKNRPSQIIADEMAFGMILAMRSRSYSAVLLKNNVVVGISQGCTSTDKAIGGVLYEARKYAANNNIPADTPIGDVLISDAELYFDASMKQLIDSGVSAIIQTGGTPTDNEFINYCDEKGVVLVFTEMTHISF